MIGVVREIKPPLTDGAPNPVAYSPLSQSPGMGTTLVVRGYGPPTQLAAAAKAAVQDAGVEAIVARTRTLPDALAAIRYPRRIAAAILGIAGVIGLMLAAVGLYGVVSYSVAQRIREFGVRMALGADRRDVVRLVIGETATVLGIALLLGGVLAVSAVRITSRFVVELPSMDPISFVAVAVFLAAVILLACYIPARRAARVDPMVALRSL